MLTLNWIDVVRVAAVLVACASMGSLVATAVPMHLLMRGLARSARRGQVNPEAISLAYRKRTRLMTRINYLLGFLLMAAVLDAGAMSPALTAVIPAVPAAGVLDLAVLGGFAGMVVMSLVATYYVTHPTYTALRGVFMDRRAYFSAVGKTMLARYVPVLVLSELAALFVGFGQFGFLLLIPLAGWAGFLVHAAYEPYEQRWFLPSQPIERTPWASFAPRIRTWARKAGIGLGDVRVLEAAQLNTAGAAILGAGKHATLFLSDNFLSATDWRQQDALVAVLLGLARQRREIIGTKSMWAAFEAAALAALFWSYLYVMGESTVQTGIASFLLMVYGAAVATTGTLWMLGRSNRGYTFPRYAQLADRFAVDLTGDPRAAMAALNTLGVLRESPTAIARRIQILYRIGQQPRNWAPWAAAPVPARIPLVLASGMVVTAPLDSAVPPPPVPEGAVSIAEPVAPAGPPA